LAKKVVIIGAGFAGLSAAAFMARAGWDVQVIEKHTIPGGRARQFSASGFTFDMGPSWYWMPDVFDRFFAQFGKKTADYYTLNRLDPSYRIYWKDSQWDIAADYTSLQQFFESVEPGSAARLDKFLAEAAYKYEVGMNKLVFKPGQSLTEFLDMDLVKGLFRLDVFTSMKKHVGKFFHHPQLQQLMEFPVLFLGALADHIPALYSLMNYADIKGGTWYPDGGMYRIVDAMHQLAVSLGVQFHFGEAATQIVIENKLARKVMTDKGEWEADVVIGGADYHFVETQLLPPAFRSYSDAYWEKRVLAPSCLLYYVGLNKRIKHLLHHSLFFDVPFEAHGKAIYENPHWPEEPLFYVGAPSVTDERVAPPGGENLFLLIPVASGLQGDTAALREKYFDIIIRRMEQHTGQAIKEAIVYQRSFAQTDFIHEYHSFKGNAYGLANTLMQTAILKPGCRSKKVKNLFYTGQLTVPGPGVPPSLISGELVSAQVCRYFG
jgi:phytoene desaturase